MFDYALMERIRAAGGLSLVNLFLSLLLFGLVWFLASNTTAAVCELFGSQSGSFCAAEMFPPLFCMETLGLDPTPPPLRRKQTNFYAKHGSWEHPLMPPDSSMLIIDEDS